MKIVSMTIRCDCETEYDIHSVPRRCYGCGRTLGTTVIETRDKITVFVNRHKR